MVKFGGVHAVLYALFDKHGKLDRGAMKAQVEHMIAIDVDGVTVLGLATEVQKLSPEEQRDIILWTAEELAGKLPFSVTISGNSVSIQREVIEFAIKHSADWLILQPPSAGAYSGDVYLDYFLAVADGYDIAFSVQNAPAYLGRALSVEDITRLTNSNPNFSLVKAETSAVDLAGLIARCGDTLTVLNGRGGLEMTDCLRAGAAGFVLAPDVIDFSKAVFNHWKQQDYEVADNAYREVLPVIIFIMQSIEHFICYGKRVYGARTGTKIFDRTPAMLPTEFGISLVENWAAQLGSLEVKSG